MTDAIIAFDDGERVEPFSFHLRNAHVFATRCGAKEKMRASSWKAVREQAKEPRKKRGINWKEAADENGVPMRTSERTS